MHPRLASPDALLAPSNMDTATMDQFCRSD